MEIKLGYFTGLAVSSYGERVEHDRSLLYPEPRLTRRARCPPSGTRERSYGIFAWSDFNSLGQQAVSTKLRRSWVEELMQRMTPVERRRSQRWCKDVS